jgi:hypothetical protein
MRLQQYLKESTSELSSQYPILMSIPKIQHRLDKVFDALDSYKDEIPNPKHKEVKGHFNYAIEDALKIEDDEPTWRWAYDKALLHPYPHQLKGKVKKAKTFPKSPEKTRWLAIHEEFLKLFNEFSKLKPVKRTAIKKETAKEKYMKTLSSSEAIRIANKAMQELVDKIEKDFIKKRIESINDMIEKFDKITDPRAKQNMRNRDNSGILYRHAFVKDMDAKAIKKIATAEASAMKEAFLMKNVDKLAQILEKKGEMKNKPTHASYRKGDFFGSMRFQFKDGSSFTVTNKVVVKVNYHGTWFNQFPTTFHNVILPDGSKMKQPSEKRMIEIFGEA